MLYNNLIKKDNGEPGRNPRSFRTTVMRGALGYIGWILLNTAAIPAAGLAATPLAVLLAWLTDFGAKAGLWPAVKTAALEMPGFVIGLALSLGAAQSLLLRRRLPRPGLWFAVTAAGMLAGGLLVGVPVLWYAVGQGWDGFWIAAAVLLSAGLVVGLAQWLYLRNCAAHASWIILVDVLAATSVLLGGRTITSLAELMVFLLPGAFTGLGLWVLLRRSRQGVLPLVEKAKGPARQPRLVFVVLGAAALVPLFFGCLWAYAAAQIASAKSGGVYPTVEEAVVAKNSEGWGSARVISIENVHAAQNDPHAQPHVWFGGATVTLDRIPAGFNRAYSVSGSYYIRVREGWVMMPESAFPEFVGWVMSLYHLEGAGQ